MKKSLILTSLILMILSQILIPAATAAAKSGPVPAGTLALLPAGTQIPDALPSGITDPTLLAGWIYLYNQTGSLPTWDGKALSGKALAEYLRDQKVKVVWNTTTECRGFSCTARVICSLRCKLGLSIRNSNPILIATSYQDPAAWDIARLAGSLAHETYHHMLPFGPGEDTLYEEYWSYVTGAYVSKIDVEDFDGYNPLTAACLKQYFSSTGRDYYNGMIAFPAAVAAMGDTKTEMCGRD
jgi:hypothetical protein